MKQNLLQIGHFPDFVQDMIDAEFHCHRWDTLQHDAGMRSQIRGIITRSNYDIPEATVEQLPNLGVIATCGVGYDLIPLELAASKGILVANTPDVLNSAVAELALALTLALLRNLPAADRFVKTSQWKTSAFPLGSSLAGKRVGIIGLGRIGKEIARRFAAFDVRISYYGRTDQNLDLHFEPDLTALARNNDILIIAAPGGSDTTDLINSSVLSALGPDGYLINIARGSLVDETALIHALRTGGISGAALDVFKNEPDINPELFELDNVILAPHMGSATHQTRRIMAELTLDNLRQFFKDGTVLTPVPS